MRKKKPRRLSAKAKRIVRAAADPKAWARLRARRRRLKAKKAADAKKKAASSAGGLLAGILAGS